VLKFKSNPEKNEEVAPVTPKPEPKVTPLVKNAVVAVSPDTALNGTMVSGILSPSD
jgi:hypothetical protein